MKTKIYRNPALKFVIPNLDSYLNIKAYRQTMRKKIDSNNQILKTLQRFDQKKDMFRRRLLEPEWIQKAEEFGNLGEVIGKPNYPPEGYVLTAASWYVEDFFGGGNTGAKEKGLYSTESRMPGGSGIPPGMGINFSDKTEITKKIKKSARLFGASLVGVCKLNKNWLYSHSYNDETKEHLPIELPESMKYAVVMAIEMDHDLIKSVPNSAGSAATGAGYSKMVFTAGLVAEFIRGLGFKAIPCGNDTALSIPLAVEAGLGELGRNGLLITEKFGPRVRLCKVFTDIPLEPDVPITFGVENFCKTCKRCAENCPSRAISSGEKTYTGKTISNNPGVLKWYINPEKCFSFWATSKTDCGVCIRVCIFNQGKGWLPDILRFIIKKAPVFNRFILFLTKLTGHGKQKAPDKVWI